MGSTCFGSASDGSRSWDSWRLFTEGETKRYENIFILHLLHSFVRKFYCKRIVWLCGRSATWTNKNISLSLHSRLGSKINKLFFYNTWKETYLFCPRKYALSIYGNNSAVLNEKQHFISRNARCVCPIRWSATNAPLFLLWRQVRTAWRCVYWALLSLCRR